MRVVLSAVAERDRWEITVYLAQQSAQVADNFTDALDVTSELLSAFPKHGHRPDGKHSKSVRCIAISGFKRYLAIYSIEGDSLTILRLGHTSRNPQRLYDDLKDIA